MQIITKEITWGGKKLVLETGKLARQAQGSVVARYGDTVILACVCVNTDLEMNTNFVPLSVFYQEKAFAAGKIPGGFFKREGKASEKEMLVSRLIDRPIRPTIIDGFNYDTQIVCTVLSYDQDTDVDIISLIASSAALQISGVPTNGIIAGCRVSKHDNAFVITGGDKDQLDLVVAGSKNGILMVESQANELTEQEMLDAIKFGHQEFQPIIKMIEEFKNQINKTDIVINQDKISEDFTKKIKELSHNKLTKVYDIFEKEKRKNAIKLITQDALEQFSEDDHQLVNSVIENLNYEILRNKVLNTNVRIDGRMPKDIREISIDLDVLPKAHGSAIFTRGETQALAIITLGTVDDEQIIDSLDKEYRERFMLHYNFPSYSVGEVGRMGPPGRREIGHGKLAWRSFNSVIPKNESDFPYTIRVVSEVLESNGSSSMATVCGTSLALMDAGVTIKEHVAGIAMGLITDGNRSVILSDISGDEDHFGDMDFKVAGTEKGITALQMDIKIDNISFAIIEQSLAQANEGRKFILNKMNQSIANSGKKLKDNVPKIGILQISKNKIREVIGPGGKVIRGICDELGVKIDINDNGTVKIFATEQAAIDAACNRIENIAAIPEIGKIYGGIIVKMRPAGAIVQFMGNTDGWLHISEISDKHVANINNILKERQKLQVKVINFEDSGRVNLTIKGVNQSFIINKGRHDQ